MPITTSAKKALRQSIRRRARNLKRLKTLRDVTKEVKSLVAGGKKDEAKALLSNAYKALDKAAKTNVIKKNTANRKKSRLALLINK
jgi:small subunit ribosomal protein S20